MLYRLMVLFVLVMVGAHAQQSEGLSDGGDNQSPVLVDESLSLYQWEKRFLDLEKKIYDQNDLNLQRLEVIDDRLDLAESYFYQLLLLLVAFVLLALFLVGSYLRSRQQVAIRQVNQALRDSKKLISDIQREIGRPELEYLRISQLLRRLMRRLRDQNQSPPDEAILNDIRNASNDPFLPASLYFIAKILTAEYDNNWNNAANLLDQLREMDKKDPDVLLHLSHVHKNIALQSDNVKTHNYHQRLAYQYYAQFTAAVKAEEIGMEAVLSEFQQPYPVDSLPSSIVTNNGQGTPSNEKTAKKITSSESTSTKASPVEKHSDVATLAKAATIPADAIQPVPIVEKIGKTGNRADSVPTKAASPVEKHSDVATLAKAATIPADAIQPVPVAEKIGKTASRTKPITTEVISSAPVLGDATTPLDSTDKTDSPIIAVQTNQYSTLQASKVVAGKLANIAHRANQKLRSFVDYLSAIIVKSVNRNGDNSPLPFLPLPPISEIPAVDDEIAMKTWENIRRGDQMLARAATEKTLRGRTRMIEAAMVCYAEAQAYKTNETLYHNWGIALLAKALHVNAKKRRPFYNAAIDKFLAGNVISPHYFDFHLASLHAIIGNKKECLKWLEISRDSNTLDVESLRRAPDFDAVRNESWFDQFLQT